MTISMYKISVPIFVQHLTALSTVLSLLGFIRGSFVVERGHLPPVPFSLSATQTQPTSARSAQPDRKRTFPM